MQTRKIECIECQMSCIIKYKHGVIECCPFCGAEVSFIDDDLEEEIEKYEED